MAKGFKTGGKNFQKGVVTNPKGREPLPPGLKEARKINRNLVEKILTDFSNLSEIGIKERLKDPETPMLERLVGRILEEAVKLGDEKRLAFVLDRLGLKPVEKIEQTIRRTIKRIDGTYEHYETSDNDED